MRKSSMIHAAVAARGRKRTVELVAVLVVIASLLAVVSGASAAGTSGGSVRIFGTPRGGGGPVIFTGAIGDFGSTQRETANGSPISPAIRTPMVCFAMPGRITGMRALS